MDRLSERTILIAGATSAAGVATARALHSAGATVLVAGSNAARLNERLGFAHGRYEVDLTDHTAVHALSKVIEQERGALDGLIHLVGGWRGGKGLAGQTDDDWDFLHHNVITTLRNTTRVFNEALLASPAGRVAIVSATAVGSPSASSANYVTAKAAAEAWLSCVAAGFTAAQSAHKTNPLPQRAAALTWVIKAFVDDAARAANPEKAYPGFTDVADLGAAAIDLFTADAALINGTRRSLVPAG